MHRLFVLEPPDLIDFSDTYAAWARKRADDMAAARQKSAEAEKPRPIALSAHDAESKASAKRDNPYLRPFGRLTLAELEQQITDTEIGIAECQSSFGDASSFKDPGRGKQLQAEYEELSKKLEALEAEYFAREQ